MTAPDKPLSLREKVATFIELTEGLRIDITPSDKAAADILAIQLTGLRRIEPEVAALEAQNAELRERAEVAVTDAWYACADSFSLAQLVYELAGMPDGEPIGENSYGIATGWNHDAQKPLEIIRERLDRLTAAEKENAEQRAEKEYTDEERTTLRGIALEWRERADAALAHVKELEGALGEIVALEPRPFDFPADWREQIDACPECQGWAKNHPIQKGICDEHRRPLYASERHEKNEAAYLGPRLQRIAADALNATPTPEPQEDR